MKLFARLFSKAPPSPPTLQERIAILNAGSADLILDAALHAEEENMRVAAQARVVQFIDEGAIDFSAFCDQARGRPLLFAVAAQCRDASRLPQALASIHDPAQLARLVVEGPSS